MSTPPPGTGWPMSPQQRPLPGYPPPEYSQVGYPPAQPPQWTAPPRPSGRAKTGWIIASVVAFVLVVAIVGVGAVVWVGSGSGSHHPATGSRNSPVAASQDATPAGAYTYRK